MWEHHKQRWGGINKLAVCIVHPLPRSGFLAMGPFYDLNVIFSDNEDARAETLEMAARLGYAGVQYQHLT